MKKQNLVAIAAMLILTAFAVGIWALSLPSSNTIPNNSTNSSRDYRPPHCIGSECIQKDVFAALPDYPGDFQDKWLSVYYGRVSDLEWIGEQYWKQPEFYADDFNRQWMEFYTSKGLTFMAGSGPYPGDVVIRDAKPGENISVLTYWHAGPANIKYQLLAFEADYPTNMSIRVGDIKVNQTTAKAKACFDVTTSPDWIILDKTYPTYGYNWAQKVYAQIHVKPGCSPGWYGVQLIPANPPQDVIERVEFDYGVTQVSSIRAGGAWQIFINVIPE
jgi:hypothetical protein